MARILTDSHDERERGGPQRGLVQLVGGENTARVVELEQVVVDLALRSLVDGFGLEALVLLASGDDRCGGPLLRSHVPPDWDAENGPLVSVHRHLWTMWEEGRRDPCRADSHLVVDGRHLWLHRAATPVGAGTPARPVNGEPTRNGAGGPARPGGGSRQAAPAHGPAMVVAAVRPTRLSPVETEALARTATAVTGILSGRQASPAMRQAMMEGTAISLKSEGVDVLAEVNADWPLPAGIDAPPPQRRRTGVGRASEPVAAVARAAAKASRPRCELVHAGVSEIEDGNVAIALVRRRRGELALGFALRPRGDLGGVAEAVFTAGL